MKFTNNSMSTAAFILSLAFLTACGKETLQDSVNSEIDRGTTSSHVLAKQYGGAEGSYLYVADPATLQDPETSDTPARIELNVKVVSKIRSGFLVPQPTLTGNFKVWKAPSLDKPVNFNYSEGSFLNGVMDISVPGVNMDGPIVGCSGVKSGVLQCEWNMSSGNAKSFSFLMKKVANKRKY